jgi:hypothetical protein
LRVDMQYLLDYGCHFIVKDKPVERTSTEENECLCGEAKQGYTYNKAGIKPESSAQSIDLVMRHFWDFPNARGNVQPWRKRLWDRRNNN